MNKCWYECVCTNRHEDCISGCVRFAEMQYLMQNSGIPNTRQYPQPLEAGVDYDAFCELAEIKDNIVEFVNAGNSIYIASNETGNGKTSWAIKLMLKYFDNIWAGNGFTVRGLFVNVPQFVLRMKDFNSHDEEFERFKENLLNVDLVIWDDIAGNGLTNYDLTQLLTYIDQRILNGKSNIYTSNVTTQQQLENAIGTRLASRIYNGSKRITFNGKDRRCYGTTTNNQ